MNLIVLWKINTINNNKITGKIVNKKEGLNSRKHKIKEKKRGNFPREKSERESEREREIFKCKIL